MVIEQARKFRWRYWGDSLSSVLVIFGTRPEAIKLAPLIKTLVEETNITTRVCITAQHREMLDNVLAFFRIDPDYDLNIMKPGQSLYNVTIEALSGLGRVLSETNPDYIVVQGDTTTAMVGALAGYYSRVKIAHVEAGLRSGNLSSPFPEEGNRIITGHLAQLHFAPTEQARLNLRREGIEENVFVVGNTVVDALHLGLNIVKQSKLDYRAKLGTVDFGKRVILVTGHRRESFGGPFESICRALKRIAESHPEVEILYPVHLNPNVQEPVRRILSGVKGVHLIDPLEYPCLIWCLNQCYLVLTDSGGIQEEAPSLGKPVLVMRDVTERTEGIDAGTAMLVGTEENKIVNGVEMLLGNPEIYAIMSKAENPYGDGKAARRIATAIQKALE